MDIRPATLEDVPRVLPMVEKICAYHQALDPLKYGFKPSPSERYRGWLTAHAGDDRSVFLVADASAKPGEPPVAPSRLAAFLIGTVEKEIPIYTLAEYGFIHDLWVEEAYRNEGVARQMVTLAIERFRAIGVAQIRLDTAARNDVARALFTTCGFRPSTTEMLLEVGAS